MRTFPLAFIAMSLLGAGGIANATVVNFDDQTAAACKAGDTYQSSGVLLSTVVASDASAVDQTLTTTPVSNCFWLINGSNTTTPPGFAASFGGGGNDVLFQFTTPVTSLQLALDTTTGESPEVVRLLALESLGSGSFRVLAVDWAYDNAVNPATILAVSLGGSGFSYAMFMTTTEQEGFDDLTFSPARTSVPEPGTLALLGVALVGLAVGRRRDPQ